MNNELFTEVTRTYKTRNNAIKVIENIEAEIKEVIERTGKDAHRMTFHWIVGVNEEGRFFPIVSHLGDELSYHYFIKKGCCHIG